MLVASFLKKGLYKKYNFGGIIILIAFYKNMSWNNLSPKVIFEEEDGLWQAISLETPPSKLAQWLIKFSGGYIKDERQANYILVIFVALAFALSGFWLLKESDSRLNNPGLETFKNAPPVAVPANFKQ